MAFVRLFYAPVLLGMLLAFSNVAALSGPIKEEQTINPSTTCYATRGLTQISSAEALGIGRFIVSLQGAWYQQKRNFPGAPDSTANIITSIGALSFGINPYIDIFGSVAGFGSINYTSPHKGGIGSVSGGFQGTIPFPNVAPIRLGAQLSVFAGTSQNQINTNKVDGYNYFETRTDFDFMGKLLQSFLLGNEEQGLKFHLNEGFVMTVEHAKGNVFTLGAGIQWNVYSLLTVGFEGNSRTFIKDIAIKSDPLWITPSVQLRTPYRFNFYAGSDISLSKDRAADHERALEPFRLFSGLAFSFDLLASKRKAAAEEKLKENMEKAELSHKNVRLQNLADSLARKAREDSLAMEREKAARDLERKRADSLSALKAMQDSIALADARHRLEIEKSKRTDAEKQLLSTGLLLLDAVYFETGKTEISINSRPYLNIIGKMLVKYPKLQLEVSGHTDNVGRVESNMRLSQARAESVRFYLTQVAPELSSRLIAHGYGPTQPKEDNKTANGRKINRRVEIQVLNKDVLREYNQ
jgi:outer membrane protein OmpA-like peptidoglycan-associated protein